MDQNAYYAAQIKNIVDLLVGLAWPAVALILVANFRPQLAELIDRLRTLKLLGNEGTFDPKATSAPLVTAASAQAQALIVSEVRDREIVTGDSAHVTDTAHVTRREELSDRADIKDYLHYRPRAAVFVAWEEVLRILREKLGDAAPEYDLYDGLSTYKTAWRRGLFTTETNEALKSLHEQRGSAMRNVVDRDKAEEYVALYDEMIVVIRTSNPTG